MPKILNDIYVQWNSVSNRIISNLLKVNQIYKNITKSRCVTDIGITACHYVS